MRVLLKADGGLVNLAHPTSVKEAALMIGATMLDTVSMPDGVHVMLVDDNGHEKGLPMNEQATILYWEKCGGKNSHVIVGDVLIVPDNDFSKE